jgi:hypothetical protein
VIQEHIGAKQAHFSQIVKLLDELGADFKAAWKTVDDIDPASDDSQVLNAALGPVFS